MYKFKCTFSGTVSDAMRRRGWVEVEDIYKEEWNIYWCDIFQLRDLFQTARNISEKQRIGHFRNCQELSRKTLLVKNLKTFRGRVEKALGRAEARRMDFMPTTYTLPLEHNKFVLEFDKKSHQHWIVKPANGSQGRGILIFQKIQEYFDWLTRLELPNELNPLLNLLSSSTNASQTAGSSISHTSNGTSARNAAAGAQSNKPDQLARQPIQPDAFVIQRYISNPYLIGGRKFDIRFYVLVTSFQPLTAWVYREGFARFAAGLFSLEALQDVYIHLTNVSIQRTSADYNRKKGSKWPLSSLREYLTARHGNAKVHRMLNQIDFIIVRTLQSVSSVIIPDRHCFEIYGFDVLLDANLFPWLLEVNACPAFNPSNADDYVLKCGLVDDTVSVLDIEGRLTGNEKRVGGYDLIWNDGPVYANTGDRGYPLTEMDGPKLNSFLGCVNDRAQQLRELYRNANFLLSAQKMVTSGAGFKMEGYGEPPEGTGFQCPPRAKRPTDRRFMLPEEAPRSRKHRRR